MPGKLPEYPSPSPQNKVVSKVCWDAKHSLALSTPSFLPQEDMTGIKRKQIKSLHVVIKLSIWRKKINLWVYRF
jgi:hypothetical protein